MLWVSKTFSDDHVLLHIPSGFDPKKPAVMLVFFHGHGATLARDVRDRQRLPDQISGAGTNAVLVAPQFAFDAADSSAGKFWEQDGFRRFLDEAAQKLAVMYGDPRSTAAFARMPIVLVSYSGGFGPTLSVLARGGADARIHGIVMLELRSMRGWINSPTGSPITAPASSSALTRPTPRSQRRARTSARRAFGAIRFDTAG